MEESQTKQTKPHIHTERDFQTLDTGSTRPKRRGTNEISPKIVLPEEFLDYNAGKGNPKGA